MGPHKCLEDSTYDVYIKWTLPPSASENAFDVAPRVLEHDWTLSIEEINHERPMNALVFRRIAMNWKRSTNVLGAFLVPSAFNTTSTLVVGGVLHRLFTILDFLLHAMKSSPRTFNCGLANSIQRLDEVKITLVEVFWNCLWLKISQIDKIEVRLIYLQTGLLSSEDVVLFWRLCCCNFRTIRR